jgi:hypothetical protein
MRRIRPGWGDVHAERGREAVLFVEFGEQLPKELLPVDLGEGSARLVVALHAARIPKPSIVAGAPSERTLAARDHFP